MIKRLTATVTTLAILSSCAATAESSECEELRDAWDDAYEFITNTDNMGTDEWDLMINVIEPGIEADAKAFDCAWSRDF